MLFGGLRRYIFPRQSVFGLASGLKRDETVWFHPFLFDPYSNPSIPVPQTITPIPPGVGIAQPVIQATAAIPAAAESSTEMPNSFHSQPGGFLHFLVTDQCDAINILANLIDVKRG